MLKKMKRTIDKFNMIAPGDKILVGVSGGPDSVALLHGLWSLREELRLELNVFHLNHMMRGKEAEEDALFVEELARRFDLPVIVERVDVPRLIREAKASAQEVAREVRYRRFYRAAEKVGAQKIALGHNLNDQAETVLMRLLRGAGTDGLAGIPPVREGKIIRPLLEITRGEIEEYLAQQGLSARLDRSNRKTRYLRNRIRMRLIPLLEKDYNPRVVELLARLAEQAREEAGFLEGAAREAYRRLAREEAADGATGRAGVHLSLAGLRLEPMAIQRRVVRAALSRAKGDIRRVDFRHVEQVLELARVGRVEATLDLPGGIKARRTYTDLVIELEPPGSAGPGAGPGEPAAPGEVYTLQVPGLTALPAWGLTMQAELLPGHQAGDMPSAQDPRSPVAHLDFHRLSLPLKVRARRPGDRFQPLGLRGSKKLKDFFIDLKVPRRERDHIPLVVSGEDEDIVWVVGWRIDSRFKVGPQTTHVLVLRALPPQA